MLKDPWEIFEPRNLYSIGDTDNNNSELMDVWNWRKDHELGAKEPKKLKTQDSSKTGRVEETKKKISQESPGETEKNRNPTEGTFKV